MGTCPRTYCELEAKSGLEHRSPDILQLTSIHSFIYSFNKLLSNFYYVPNTIKGTEDLKGNKSDTNPFP